MGNILSWIMENTDAILSVATGVVATASAVAALTPTPKDDTFAAKAYKIVDFLALNFGHAKEK